MQAGSEFSTMQRATSPRYNLQLNFMLGISHTYSISKNQNFRSLQTWGPRTAAILHLPDWDKSRPTS